MKNLILILTVLIITFSTVYGSNTPAVMIKSDLVEVVTVESLDIFTNAEFDASSENLVFDTKVNISIVQIYNVMGKLEFQLPVMSNNVNINKNLFNQGNYKLGFILEGQSEVYFTKVSIK